MFKQNKWFSVFLFCVLVVDCLPQLHGAPSQGTEKTKSSNPIVYKRYVRRHPGNNEIDYVEEVFEEFYMRHKPPARQLSEEELDLLIRCDFDPSLTECKNLNKSKPTRPPTISKSTTTKTPTQPPTSNKTSLPTTPATSSTTEDLPNLPNVPTSDEAPYDTENVNEYEDENENDNDIENENEDYNDEEENEEAEEEVDANDYLNDI